MESCEVCGFVWDEIALEQIEPRLRVALVRYHSLLRASDSSVTTRPKPEVWSALEYSAHMRDVLLVIRERAILAAIEDHPAPRPMHRDHRVAMGLYGQESAAAVAQELATAVDLLTRAFAALPDDAWARPLTYGDPGVDRTILWMGAQAVHEMEHHLSDAEASVGALDTSGVTETPSAESGLIMEIVVDCRDPATLSTFWAEILGGRAELRSENWATVRDPRPGGVLLAFQRVPEPKSVKNRLHLDVWSRDLAGDAERAVAHGASIVGDVVADEQGPFQVMADPEGNEFCLVG